MSGLQGGRPSSSNGVAPYASVAPHSRDDTVFVPVHAHGNSVPDSRPQQYNNSTKGAGYIHPTGQMGGIQLIPADKSWWSTGSWGLAILQWGILAFLLIGGIWFFTQVPDYSRLEIVLEGVHTKDHRIYIQRNMVNIYNHTTLGVAVFQGGLLIGSPTIPGSGYLIVNKRNAAGKLHDLTGLNERIIEETDEHLYIHNNDGQAEFEARKRGVQAYSPASLYSGINIRDQSNIAMNGGDILGVDTITAMEIVANVRSQKNASSAQVAQMEPGMIVGFQLNGSVGLGFAQNPASLPALVKQDWYLDTDDADGLVSVRFNEEKFAVLYQNESGGPVLSIVGTLDVNNRATYQGSAASIVLPAGTLGTDMLACSFEEEDGTGANVVLVVYKSAIDNDLYARVCDLSVPTAPVCGPSTNVSTGDAGTNGVYIYAASNIVLQSLTCLTHPSDGALTTQRWFVVAWTDSASGHMMAQQIQANVALPLPVTTVVTAPRTVGIVDNLTDVSTSNDLANSGKNTIAVDRLQGPNFVTAWRTGLSQDEGKFEVDFINVTSLTIELASRSATPFVTTFDNLADAFWEWDISVSQREPHLLGGEKQTIFIVYNIGPSAYGQLFFSTLEVPAVDADVVDSDPWIVDGTVQFSNKVNPLYTYSFPASAGLMVEGICSNQALVSYVSGGVGIAQSGYVVLVNMAPTQACVDGGLCASVSTPVPYSNGAPYLATILWRTLASDGFDCSSSALSSFVTVYASYVDVDYYNTSIRVATGVAGEYTVSFAPLDTPRQVVGVISAVYEDEGLVSYITTGEINLCATTYKIDGRPCPFEAPAAVYSCPSGLPTFSLYCADTDVNSPGQLVGYSDIWGNLQVQPQVQNAF